MMGSREDVQIIPDIDSEEDNFGELTLLGLNEENLPPEFRRSFEELNEDEKALYHAKQKWLHELHEEGRKKLLKAKEKVNELPKDPQEEKTQRVPPNLNDKPDINDVLKELDDFEYSLMDSKRKAVRLRALLVKALNNPEASTSSKAKVNRRMKFLRTKFSRLIEQTLGEVPKTVYSVKKELPTHLNKTKSEPISKKKLLMNKPPSTGTEIKPTLNKAIKIQKTNK